MKNSNVDIKSIFGRAVALAPGERAAYLEGACAGDAGLREEVESLLRAHGDAGPFLGERGPSAAATTDGPGGEGPGTVIGPYTLWEQIGEGGMGLVFVAEQHRPVRRRVALKVIKPGMDTRQVVARFEAERQALALMDHPHIAKVLDGGETASGRPYFVMELVRGVPVTQFCDDGRLGTRERLGLFVSVCHAVQHAHQKGVIHRDLKPSNVLVASHDGTPVPKVIDFGVAKAVGQSLTDKTVYTGLAQMVGTPLYMSPEQAGMSGLDVDTRSDVYALGVLLYELLTGSTPFERERLRAAGYDELRRIIREEEPPRPSTRLSTLGPAAATACGNRRSDPKGLSRLLRGELDWVVMRCLEKDRNRRYESANALARDVERYLADEPVEACPPSAGYRLRKFARRNQGRLAAAAGVFLAVTVMAASIGWAVRDRAARRTESEQAETARRANVEGQVRGSLNTARILIADNKLASAREKLAQARAQLGNDSSALGDLAAEVEASQAGLDRFQQFLDLIERAHQAETAPLLEAASAADGPNGGAGTPTPSRVGRRRPAAAVPLLREALQRYGILEDDWGGTLEGGLLGRQQVEQIRRLAYEELLWLAEDVILRQQGHRSEGKLSPQAAARVALVYLGKAEGARRPTRALYALRGACRKALGEEAAAQADTQLAAQTPATVALDHSLRGQAAYDGKQLAEGAQAFEAALRLEPTHYWSMMRLGYCLCDLGRGPEDFDRAALVFTGCVLKRPDHAHAYLCRAIAYTRLRRYEEAVADSSKAIELDPQQALAWFGRGNAYNKLSQPGKALADYTRALELDPQDVNTWNNRGLVYAKLGQPGKAAADYSRALELDPQHVNAWYNRGLIYSQQGQQGQPGKAVADFSKVIELEPQRVEAWYNRGVAHHSLSRFDKAVADFSRALELSPKHTRAWNNRGAAYNRLGQPGKAVADFSRAIEIDPQHAYAWHNRGLAYTKLGQPDKAVTDFSKAIELGAKDADPWYSRGNAYRKLGQPDKAVTDFSKAIELKPKDAKAWNNRGAAYNKLGQPDKALADYSKALELGPKYALAWYNRGNTYAKLGQPEKAVADYSKAIELGPKYVDAWYNRGLLYNRLGQPDKAVADLSRAVELAPKAAMCWNALGVAHYRAGDWKAAAAALDKSRQLPPGADAGDWFFLAMARRKLGHHDEAREAYEQALQWLEKNREALDKDKGQAEELRRFRAEAEEVLGLKKK